MSGKSLDKRPFLWAIAIVIFFILAWQGLEYVGDQRLHNGPLWQRWHPLVLHSGLQTATPVKVEEKPRIAQTVVQTELGVYFLVGASHVPQAGTPVVIVANDNWDLYLCAADGQNCMTIYSFCSGAVWPKLERDADGRIEGCHAPRLAEGTLPVVAAITNPPPDRSGSPGGRTPRVAVAQGVSHPREWAHLMGLPISPMPKPETAKP